MDETRAKRKLSAILSADVKGYSRLMGDDELATIESLKKSRQLISHQVEQFQGHVIDSPGDNLLAEFGSVVDAVDCAISIQKELEILNQDLPENRRMEFRIGINLGDIVEDGGNIYGDGVNIAARMESLADGGGICISANAYHQVKNKKSVGFEYLGKQKVKNIKEPIGAYKILMDEKSIGTVVYRHRRDDPGHRKIAVITLIFILITIIASYFAWPLFFNSPAHKPASLERMAFPLPDKPSIAVLPFTNMSNDPEQDYIGDGLSENILTALSASSRLFVIARNSSFAYKGTQVKVQKVAEDLGVQYVLEGSIQKADDRIRVTAQLINALTGHHLWAEKYDRELKDFFKLQDEITKKIVVALQVQLSHGESLRLSAKATDNLDAWTHYIKAIDLVEKVTRENNIKARQYVETAIRLDPLFSNAHTFLAVIYVTDAKLGFSDDPAYALAQAYGLVQKAISMDPQNAFARSTLGDIYLNQRQHDKAVTEGEKAIALNPNYAGGYGVLATAMHFSGRFEESVSLMKKAFRLDPKITPSFQVYWCKNYIFLEQYDQALDLCHRMEEQARQGKFAPWIPPILFANIYQEMGREDEARIAVEKALQLRPDLSLEFFKIADPYKDPDHLQRVLVAYRQAGLPEKPSPTVQ